jgi:hypothetical protein
MAQRNLSIAYQLPLSPMMAACHSAASCSAFGSFGDVGAGVLESDELAAAAVSDPQTREPIFKSQYLKQRLPGDNPRWRYIIGGTPNSPGWIGYTGNARRQIHGEVNEQIRCREIQLGALRLKYGHHLFAAGEKTGGTYPMPPTGPLAFQLKFGRTSAPLLPQALHAKRASRSDSRTSSGQRSALIAIEWLQ